MIDRPYSNKQTRIKQFITEITGVLFLFYVISCGSSGDITSPSGKVIEVGTIKALTLNGVSEDSISLDWNLLKTEEGIVDDEITYTVYAEADDGEGVFIKIPDTETVYTLAGENPLPADDTGRTTGITVTNLTNNTPYRIVVEANDASGDLSRSRLLAYTSSALVEVDIGGVEVNTDSEEITVTWDPQEGAQAYLIQVSEDESQIGNDILADNVLAVVCRPNSFLCERPDQFAEPWGDSRLEYVLRVNQKEGKYKLAVIPFNFRDLGGLQAVDEEGRVKTFTEGVLMQVEDENSELSQRLQAALDNNAQEVQVKVSIVGAPTDLVLDSTEDTLSANWAHGRGAESYYAILTSEGIEAVTNTIDRDEASVRGYTVFSNLSLNTFYTVTVQSLMVSNGITHIGGEVSKTLSTKDVPEAVVNLSVIAGNNQATVTWEKPPISSPVTKYVLEYLSDVSTTIINIGVAGDDTDAELSGLSWEGYLSIDVNINSSGSYSQVVSGLNTSSAINVFRVRAVRVDDSGKEWLGEYRYYALGVGFSRAPSSVGELILSEHTIDGSSFKVTWTKPGDPGQDKDKASARLVGYKVSWGTTAEVAGGSNEIADPDILFDTITNLIPGTRYYVKVQARNNNVEGYIYNAGSTDSTYTIKKPGTVSFIAYSEHTTDGFKVSWDAVTDAGYGPEGVLPSVGYRLDFSADQGKSWQSVTRSDYSATEETLADLISGANYRVRITVTNKFYRNTEDITTLYGDAIEGGETWTLSLPGQVGDLVVSDPDYDGENHNGGFKVSWAAPPDTGRASDGNDATVTGYEVAYVEDGDSTGYTLVTLGATSTEYVFAGLKTNAEYDIRIRARTAAGVGMGNHVSGWTPSLPGTVNPGLITFSSPTSSTIQIEWDAPEPGRAGGASSNYISTSYTVEIVPEKDKENENAYILVRDDYPSGVITVINLDKSTSYRARITAKNIYGKAAASVSTDTGTTAAVVSTPPSAVGTLKVEVDSVTDSKVVLSWIVPSNTGTINGDTANLTGYVVKYRETAKSDFIEIDENSERVRLSVALTGTSTTATVVGLSGNTDYTFLVVAVNSGNAVGSDTEAPRIEQTTAPSPPKGLRKSTTCDKTTSVDLAWDISPGATSYKIYRDNKDIRSIPNNSYADTGLTAGTTYIYKVQACSSVGCSGDSDSLTVTNLRDKSFKSIIDSGTIPVHLTDYDERSQEIFSLYNAGASIEAKYVKEGGGGNEDGSSFKNAAGDLKTVLDGITSSANNVYVVFLSGGPYPISQTISMKNHVAIVGGVDECLGFSDTVTTLERKGDNGRIFYNASVTNTALLYGITIANGEADQGGGMYNWRSSPSLIGVTFSGNTASATVNAFGGGMYNDGSSPNLTRVTFSGNKASATAYALGGGMYNINNSSPSLTNVTFSGNTTTEDGGGMYNNNSSPILSGVTFSGNTASDAGGGMYNNALSSPSLIRVTFSENTATYGSGMYNDNSSPILSGVTFSGNTASDAGGGMYNNNKSSPRLIGATFSGNTATKNGGGMYNDNDGGTGPLIINGIFWGNTANTSGPEFYFYNDGTSQENLQIYNSIVAGGTNNLINGESNTFVNHGGFVSGGGSARVVISFTNIIATDPQLGALTDNGGSVLPHHAILENDSPAVDQGLFVRKEGSTYYYGMEDDNGDIVWYTKPDLSVTAATPPGDAEDLTATDATGHTRTGRPDLGAYEAR